METGVEVGVIPTVGSYAFVEAVYTAEIFSAGKKNAVEMLFVFRTGMFPEVAVEDTIFLGSRRMAWGFGPDEWTLGKGDSAEEIWFEHGVAVEFEEPFAAGEAGGKIVGTGQNPWAGLWDGDYGDVTGSCCFLADEIWEGVDEVDYREMVWGTGAPVDEDDFVIGGDCGAPAGKGCLEKGGSVLTGG